MQYIKSRITLTALPITSTKLLVYLFLNFFMIAMAFSSSLLHVIIACNHQPICNIFKFCTFLPKFTNILHFFALFKYFFFFYLFLPFFWKIIRMPLRSRIGPDNMLLPCSWCCHWLRSVNRGGYLQMFFKIGVLYHRNQG